jgi:hypothetical protein
MVERRLEGMSLEKPTQVRGDGGMGSRRWAGCCDGQIIGLGKQWPWLMGEGGRFRSISKQLVMETGRGSEGLPWA